MLAFHRNRIPDSRAVRFDPNDLAFTHNVGGANDVMSAYLNDEFNATVSGNTGVGFEKHTANADIVADGSKLRNRTSQNEPYADRVTNAESPILALLGLRAGNNVVQSFHVISWVFITMLTPRLSLDKCPLVHHRNGIRQGCMWPLGLTKWLHACAFTIAMSPCSSNCGLAGNGQGHSQSSLRPGIRRGLAHDQAGRLVLS